MNTGVDNEQNVAQGGAVRLLARLDGWVKAHPIIASVIPFVVVFFSSMAFRMSPWPLQLAIATLCLALIATGVVRCIWRPSGDGAAFGIIFFVGLPLVILGVLCLILMCTIYLSPAV
jgi:hypothetical protein